MQRVFPLFLCLFSAFLAANSAYAGAWLQPLHKGYASSTLRQFSSDRYWDAEGIPQTQPRFSKWEIQPYAEYGLTDDTTLGGSLFLQTTHQGNNHALGVADPEIFSRHRLWEGRFWKETRVLSLQPLLKFPSQFTGDATPRGGTPSTDAEISLLYGQSYRVLSKRDYLDTRLGYRTRSLDLQGQIRADIALGLYPWGGWVITPALRYTGSRTAPHDTLFTENGAQDYRLLKGELGIGYAFSNQRTLTATYFTHLSGQQTGLGQGISIGYATAW